MRAKLENELLSAVDRVSAELAQAQARMDARTEADWVRYGLAFKELGTPNPALALLPPQPVIARAELALQGRMQKASHAAASFELFGFGAGAAYAEGVESNFRLDLTLTQVRGAPRRTGENDG